MKLKKMLPVFAILALQCALVAGQMSKKIYTQPAYPQMNQPVTVFVNTHYWPNIDTSKIDVYTGLITSESKNIKGDWKNVVPADWSNHPDSLRMKKVNDSIFSFTINDIRSFYKVAETVEVFRITFIARADGSGQTEDLFIDVFNADAADKLSNIPRMPKASGIVAVTINLNKTEKTLKAYLAANPSKEVFAYTAANTNMGVWQHQVSDWGSVGANADLKLLRLSDSIFRLYIQPSPDMLYKIENPAEALSQLNFVFRDSSGSYQTDDLFVPLAFSTPKIAADVKDVLLYPKYPTVNDKIFIYVNANAYGFNPMSGLSAYTGMVNSTSAHAKDWKNVANSDWNDLSLTLTRLNDSIHVFEIPSIKDLYKIDPASIEVFRLTFIARDSANNSVSKQTPDMFFDIFGEVPTKFITTQPKKLLEGGSAVVTVNVYQDKKGLAEYIANTGDNVVYAYTAINSSWQNQVSDWGTVKDNDALKCITVSDSIYRFFITPNARDFYKIADTCTHVYTSNIVFRNADGSKQANDAIVQFDTTAYVACPVVGISSIENATLSIYPNPATNLITVASNASISEISVANLMGQQMVRIVTSNTNSVPVSLSHIERGIYVVSVKTADNKTVFQKIIKQ